MLRWLVDHVNLWVMLGAVLVAGGLIFLLGLLVVLSPSPEKQTQNPVSAMTVIPAPTATATPTQVLETPTPTPPQSVGGIAVGNFVQITGTEGQGLRLRSGPGTTNPPRFLGMDSEVFMVKDGPRDSDGFTWWFLEAPYDPARSGWAASSFLQVINPTATP